MYRFPILITVATYVAIIPIMNVSYISGASCISVVKWDSTNMEHSCMLERLSARAYDLMNAVSMWGRLSVVSNECSDICTYS